MNETKQRYHPLTLVAFLLALLVLIAPTQADLVFAALLLERWWQALMTIAISLAMVIVPLVVAQVQTKKQPDRWKPRFLTKLTWCIVVLNVVFNLVVFTNFKKTETGANRLPGS